MAIDKGDTLVKQTKRIGILFDIIRDQLSNLVIALEKKDIRLADRVRKSDQNVNIEYQYIIDKSSWILSQHNYLASELRQLIAYNSVAKELERIGDVIAGAATYYQKNPSNKIHFNVFFSALKELDVDLGVVSKLLVKSTEADIVSFVKKNLARIDIFEKNIKEYVIKLAKTNNIDAVQKMIDEVGLLRRLQRLFDYVTNICEYLIYIKTGQNIDF